MPGPKRVFSPSPYPSLLLPSPEQLSKERPNRIHRLVLNLLVHSRRLHVSSEEILDPGWYLMYNPVLEIFPYLGSLPGLLASAKSESNCFGWFCGTVACMTMAIGDEDLAETFSADPPVFLEGK